MKPSEWMISILDRYGLQKPDGRPLYQYRITDNEFVELTKLLKLSSLMGVKHIRQMFMWDAVFVIYGAEWWRRHYTGDWGWDGIFTSIGINLGELSVGKRNALIEKGLHRWKRDVRVQDGTRKFLGTVATEGGLPLHQLADSGGWLEHILKPVLRKHLSRDFDVLVLIDAYQDLIPKSYRTAEINQILADIIQTIVLLRKEHQLTDKDSPLQWLDDHHQNWRELFPLPIDDEAGRHLLSDLIDTASKTREVASNKNPFEVERYLVRTDTQQPNLVAQIELPTFVNLSSIGIDEDSSVLPSVFDVEIYEPAGSAWQWCKGITTIFRQKKAIKLTGRSIKLNGLDATKELKLRFKSAGKVIYEAEVIQGSSLDIQLPWLFKNIDDKWMFYGAASQSIKDAVAMVYLPDKFKIQETADDCHIDSVGGLFSGDLVKISGVLHYLNADEKYKLSTGAEESVDQFYLTGHRFDGVSKPSEVYIGHPVLKQVNLITESSSIINIEKVITKPIGLSSSWFPLSQAGTGCFEVRLLDDQGNIKLQKRIGILGSDFGYYIKPDKATVNNGIIELSGVNGCEIKANKADVVTKISQQNPEVIINLEAIKTPPISIDVALLPHGHTKELLLTLPYPSKGAQLFDANGMQVPFTSMLYMNNLMGYRIKIYSDQYNAGRKVDLLISLVDPSMTSRAQKEMCIQKKIQLDTGITEFSIFDWSQYIESLLSVSTSLDSKVKISMIMNGQEAFTVMVSRYENEIIGLWDQGAVGLSPEVLSGISYEMLENTHLSALYLNQPEQENVTLQPKTSNDVLTGEWIFSPEKRENGPWLIYPVKDSAINFRTLLWNVGELEDQSETYEVHIDTLPKAVRIINQQQRLDAIRSVIKSMAMDLNHKSWAYLDNLWDKTSHLPMITFDIWKIAVSESVFMACLLIKDYDAVIQKLERELPVIWELVRIDDWESSLILYKERIKDSLDDEGLVNTLIETKLNKIESLSLSMASTAKILRARLLGEVSHELKIFQLPVNQFLKPELVRAYQSLLRGSVDYTWPMLLKDHIFHTCQNLPKDYVSLLNTEQAYQISVVFLPALLAWRSLASDISDWPLDTIDIFKIKQLKEFDEDWFDHVYQLLTGWLFYQNSIRIS